MIRVLVVDDSALVRKILTRELSKASDIEVVGSAVDPFVARDKIVALAPDVVTLDIEMPRMDGLTFLEKLMRHHPIPVVVLSSVAQKNSANALQALRLGAVEVIGKPGSSLSTGDIGEPIRRAVRTAAASRVRPPVRAAPPPTPTVHPARNGGDPMTLIAIGASTGGTQAIEAVLAGLPADSPPIVVAQHMPAAFTASFAERLDRVCPMRVREARARETLEPGLALVAPGGWHMVVERVAGRYVVNLRDTPPVHHQRPAVDVLFNSVARAAGSSGLGALLTGMGADGASGLLRIREAGGHTIAEDESTCVVFGMPREAIELDAALEVIPLPGIAVAIRRRLSTAAVPNSRYLSHASKER